jgi:Rad3-related DNA helicase
MGDSSNPQSTNPQSTNPSTDLSTDQSTNSTQDEALAAIAHLIRTTAQARQGDTLALLALLRTVEALHQEIRDGAFQDSFPDNRQALYSLLRDIETEGGWPHIYRPRLSAFIAQLMADETNEK